MGRYKFTELVDITKLQDSLDLFYKVTGFANAILDPEENVLVAAGWSDICTKFHRCHPILSKRCLESDAYIKSHLLEGDYAAYQCKNGLWDVAFPIVITGEHLATFFFGQFFYEDQPPDIERFSAQAQEAGFDEDAYLAALSKVPLFSRKRVAAIIAYYKNIATMLAEIGLNNLQLGQEITERKNAKKALSKNEKKYRQLVENVNSIILRWDTEGKIKFLNSYGLNYFGFDENEIIGKSAVGTIVPESESTGRDLKEMIANIATNPEKYAFNQNENTKKDGTRVWVEWRNQPVYGSNGKLKEILSTGIDITERKRVEQALAEKVSALRVSEEKNRTENALKKSILESPLDIVIFALDRDYRYTAFNHNHKNTMKHIWGVDIKTGMRMLDVITRREDREKAKHNFDRALNGDQFKIIEAYGSEELERSYCENHYNPIKDDTGAVIGLTVFLTDVTEHEQLENERAKAAKLESIGVLAGGIAHDFNNILTAVIGNLSLANAFADDDVQMAREVITEAEQACLRAKGLTQQLLTFAKGGEPIKKITSLSTLIRNSVSFSLRGSSSKCNFSIEEKLWDAEVDEDQISQVLNNLVINADQAMPDGGMITVQAENVNVGKNNQLPLKPGRYVKTTITDQGHGIAPNLLHRIFDPYFTTKQKGNGLGLATSYSIVKKHGGHITASSAQDAGATFRVYLPASSKQISISRTEIRQTPVAGGKILVMDDDQGVISVVEKMMDFIGHSMVTAADGEEAVMLFKNALRNGEPFDAVILDLTIPGGLGGRETVKKLREINPEVKAIVSSGYSNDPVLANPSKYGFSGVIVKPYRLEELKSKLLDVMAQKP